MGLIRRQRLRIDTSTLSEETFADLQVLLTGVETLWHGDLVYVVYRDCAAARRLLASDYGVPLDCMAVEESLVPELP